MPRKPSLSPTRIRTFLECAVRYRYIYVDRIGRFYQKARAGYSFGSTLHAVLQSFHAGGATQTADELRAEVDRRWISAGYTSAQQEEEHRALGADAVAAYHALALHRTQLGIQTYLTEQTIRHDMGDFWLTGRVDRVDRYPDGSLEIVDYKSGRTQVAEADVAESLAMGIYQLILRRRHPGVPVMATIIALRTGVGATWSVPDADLDRFETDLLEIGRRILSTDFNEVTQARMEACDDCDFRTLCERRWRAEARHDEPS